MCISDRNLFFSDFQLDSVLKYIVLRFRRNRFYWMEMGSLFFFFILLNSLCVKPLKTISHPKVKYRVLFWTKWSYTSKHTFFFLGVKQVLLHPFVFETSLINVENILIYLIVVPELIFIVSWSQKISFSLSVRFWTLSGFTPFYSSVYYGKL